MTGGAESQAKDFAVSRHMSYASGNLGKSCLGSFLELFALFYLTDILGIPAATAGAILFLSLIWDGVIDPLMGIAADRLRRTIPTVRPYFLVGAPLTAITFVAFFHAYVVPPDQRILYVCACLVLFRLFYTMVDVPHNSMLSFLTRDSRNRTNIASMRIFFSAAGKIIVTVGATAVFVDHGTPGLDQRFALAAVILAALYLTVVGFCLSAIWNVRIGNGNRSMRSIGLGSLIRSITGNSQLAVVFSLTAITSLTTPIIGNVVIYYGKYGLMDEQAGAAALVIMSATQAASVLFWSRLSNRLIFKRHAAQAANGLLALAMMAGIVNLNSVLSLFVVAALAGWAIGGVFMLNWSMLPDALEAGRPGDAEHNSMSVFGLYALTNKGFIGLSQALVGLVLAVHGYQADSILMTDRIGSISTTLLALPCLGAVACAILLRWYIQAQSPVRP